MLNKFTPHRRHFLGTSLAAGSAALSTLTAVPAVHAAGSDVLRVGLVGCGGRGTGAALQALKADAHVRLVALADMFDDRLKLALESLKKEAAIVDKLDVPPERQFVGFNAYRELLASGVDVVLLATPPGFRPLHLAACVEAGKHVFAEKPVAVDGPGVRQVLETCQRAKQKGLSVVSGLCLRYSRGYRETVERLRNGAVGAPHTLYANDYRGPIWVRERKPDWTDMHWQLRNWYYFTWLCGDFNVEQHVHNLDVCAWILGDKYPTSAVGLGGRQQRTGPEFGNIYDHFSVTYEYESGERIISNTRQMPGCVNDISVQVQGSAGRALVSEKRNGLKIDGEKPWTWPGGDDDFYQYEHDALFASIRSGQPINNGPYMTQSTLLAILGRMAAYTGQRVTWDQALNSRESLMPAKLEFGPLATPSIAVPGITKVM